MGQHNSVLLKSVVEALAEVQWLNGWYRLKNYRDVEGQLFRVVCPPKQDPGSQSHAKRISPVTFVSHRDDFLDEIGIGFFFGHLLCSSSHPSYMRLC